MPFSFVICGVIFLFLLFRVIDFKSNVFKFVLMLYFFLFMLGFFFGNVDFSNVYFNCIHLCLFALLALFVFVFSKKRLLDILNGLFFSLIFYMIVNFGFAIDFSMFGLVFVLIAISCSFVSSSLFDSLLTVLVCVFLMTLVLIDISLESYTFASVDFDMVFLTTVVCYLLNYCRFNFFDYKRRKLFYVS